MNFSNEWDTFADWVRVYITKPPLPFFSHVGFVTSLVFIILAIRIIIQHRWLQRWAMIKCMGNKRTQRARSRRRVVAEIIWHIVVMVYMYIIGPAITDDQAWFDFNHLRDRTLIFGSHPALYVWYCALEAYIIVHLLWLLQYRRFYREYDITVSEHFHQCMLYSAFIIIIVACEWTGYIKYCIGYAQHGIFIGHAMHIFILCINIKNKKHETYSVRTRVFGAMKPPNYVWRFDGFLPDLQKCARDFNANLSDKGSAEPLSDVSALKSGIYFCMRPTAEWRSGNW